MAMKRVLIITYYWPPTGGSGVQRWVKFSKYLPSQGWQPVIYTPENPERSAFDGSLLDDIPECAEIIRTSIREPYAVYRKFQRQSEVNPINSRKNGLFKKLSVFVRGNFFIPDPRVSWVRPSVRYLKEYLREHPVDAIVTTGPPQSMHLIGLGLMEALRKDNPAGPVPRWIVDFRDPWTEMFYFKHLALLPFAKRRHFKLEQKVLDGADCIISVTPLVREDFQRKTSTPVELITNGFDEEDFTYRGEQEPDALFRVVHTGLFSEDGNPFSLWRALAGRCGKDAEFRRALRICLAGKVDRGIIDAIVGSGLEENLETPGYLPHTETVVLQRKAAVLILPLRHEPEYRKVLPGKIFEYLAARRPVLGIGQEDGAAAKVLSDSGSGVMFDWDREAEMDGFIGDVWEEFRRNGGPREIDNDIEEYTRKALTGRLARIL